MSSKTCKKPQTRDAKYVASLVVVPGHALHRKGFLMGRILPFLSISTHSSVLRHQASTLCFVLIQGSAKSG
jgi:hypothetical protein